MAKNPFMDRAEKRGSMEHGRTSEKRVANTLSARLSPASGAMRGAKSDMYLKTAKAKLQIESKATKNATISVEHGWLVKVTDEAQATGSVPALTLSFVDEMGKSKPRGDWVAVPMWFFQELTED